jgi:hypothetical protein
MGGKIQLFILGDYMQGIYDFKGADVRSLTHAHLIWRNHPSLSSRVFHQCSLNISYRITIPMQHFNNNVLLGTDRLKAIKPGPPVEYYRNTKFNLEMKVIATINQLLANGVSPGDIFILAASVKNVKGNVRQMENALVERDIPCYVPAFDNEGIDDKVIEGKVVFSTFHSVKGRERPYVFLMGFDQSYFVFFAQNLPTDKCPNPLYVGCTRATYKMYLLENCGNADDRPLDFLKKTHREMKEEDYIAFHGVPCEIVRERIQFTTEKEKYSDLSPSDLTKYIPEHVLENVSPLVETIFIQESEPSDESTIDVPNIIPTSRGGYEDVCDLNGIAVPSIYFDHLFRRYEAEGTRPVNIGANILRHIINDCLSETAENKCLYLKREVDSMPEECTTSADYLRLANLYVAAKERLYFKWRQIDQNDYTWLSPEMVGLFMERMDSSIGAECVDIAPKIELNVIDREMENEHEKINTILQKYMTVPQKVRFSARIDTLTVRTLWEIKCANSITIEHKLQTVLYAWLWYVINTPEIDKKREAECQDPREVRLFNIKTGEILRLNATFEELTIIVVELLKGKFEKHTPKTNEEFLQDCEKFIEIYLHRASNEE